MSKYNYINRLLERKAEIENENYDSYVEEKVAEFRANLLAEVKQSHDLALVEINIRIDTAMEFATELEKEYQENLDAVENCNVENSYDTTCDTAEETI